MGNRAFFYDEDKIMNFIHAIEIYTGRNFGTYAEIGLYQINSESVFRLLESPANLPDETWSTGLIAKGGISDIKQKGDFRKGGSPVTIDGLTIQLINTNHFVLKCQELGINLYGCKCKVLQFIGTDEDSDSIETSTLFSGIIDNFEWDETICQLSIYNSRSKRKVNIGTTINNGINGNRPDALKTGDMIPVTFGKFYPTIDTSSNNFAKFVRTAAKETKLSNVDFASDSLPVIDRFPVVSSQTVNNVTTPTLQYTIKYRSTGNLSIPNEFPDLYIKVKSGDGAGEYRKVVSLINDGTDKIIFTIENYFSKTLAGSEDGTIENNSWIEIIDIKREYESDVFDCGGFLDGQGNQTIVPELYGYDEGFTRILPQGYNLDTAKNTSLVIDPTLFKSEPDNMYSFLLVPVKNIDYVKENNLSLYSTSVQNDLSTYTKVSDGVYTDGGVYKYFDNGELISLPLTVDSNVITYKKYDENGDLVTDGSVSNAFDRDPNSLVRFYAHYVDLSSSFYHALKLDLPEIPKDLKFDNCFLGLRAITTNANTNSTSDLTVVSRRFLGYASYVLDKVVGDYYSDVTTGVIHTLPDWYWSTPVNYAPHEEFIDSNNLYFSVEKAYTAQYSTLQCHKNLNLNINDFDTYKNLQEISLLFKRTGPLNAHPSSSSVIDIYDAALIFEKTTDIKDAIYTPYSGRKYKSEWRDKQVQEYQVNSILDSYPVAYQTTDRWIVSETPTTPWTDYPNHIAYLQEFPEIGWMWQFIPPSQGMTVYVKEQDKYLIYTDEHWIICPITSDVIDNPIHILEHIKRLQNWSESTNSTDTVVNYGTEYSPSAQIKLTGEGSFDSTSLNEIKALTPARQIFDYNESWSDSLTTDLCKSYFLCSYQDEEGKECINYLLRDENPSEIVTFDDIVDDIGKTIEPLPQDIYVEPYVKYCFNYGSESYERELRVTNVNQNNWNASYTQGFTNEDGLFIWNSCKDLFNKYKTIEVPPSELTDQIWVRNYSDAVWFIKNWVKWQGKKRVSFSVDYYKGRKWSVSQMIKLKLPHQTNNSEIRCLIESIDKSVRKNKITIQVVLIDEIPTNFFFYDMIQNTWTNPTSLDAWQEVYKSFNERFFTDEPDTQTGV